MEDWNYQDKTYKIWLKNNIRKKECCTCGTKWDLEIHHKIPMELGGLNTIDNVVFLCDDCHKELHRIRKINPTPRDFLKRLGILRKKYRGKK